MMTIRERKKWCKENGIVYKEFLSVTGMLVGEHEEEDMRDDTDYCSPEEAEADEEAQREQQDPWGLYPDADKKWEERYEDIEFWYNFVPEEYAWSEREWIEYEWTIDVERDSQRINQLYPLN